MNGRDCIPERAELFNRLARLFAAQPFDPVVEARHLRRLRELAAGQLDGQAVAR